jgi:hypothetical protein
MGDPLAAARRSEVRRRRPCADATEEAEPAPFRLRLLTTSSLSPAPAAEAAEEDVVAEDIEALAARRLTSLPPAPAADAESKNEKTVSRVILRLPCGSE